ncbi:FAD dependent oxidoreductase [Aspergillus minisclerotigenes]|uniref:FAD dependent oxidoreductase n=1 Tax=Aspergillus minisclerotigenes TaxID=656917 RepID=A0A5N6J8S2_9EURO|nr:FAD dependent oxidoreductase [Aspergillus minisclerotigenes]
MPAPKSIIIVGSGVFGLSTAYAMSQNNEFASTKITLIDSWNFEPSGPSASTPNPSAANFDTSRIIRSDYSHRIYAALAREAQQKWKAEWGADGRYRNQSIVMIGEGHSMKQPMKPLESINYVKHAYAQSYERAGRNSDIVHILDSESAVWEALGLGTPDEASNVGPKASELRGYRNHNCGWAESGATMAWLRQKTIHSNRIDIHIGQVVGLRVCSDSPSESHVNAELRVCGVILDDGSQLTADLTVLAAGAMTPRLLGSPTLCDVYSETVAYVQLTEMERRELVRREFPLIVNVARKIFAIGPDNQGFLKLARFSWSGYRDVQKFAGVDVGPRSQAAPQEEDGYGTCGDLDQTNLSPDVESTLQDYRGFLRELFRSRDGGDLGGLRNIATRPFAQVRRCWYADTVSTDFIVDYHPAYGKSLFIATGGSDHAFKFLPVLGERICELILQGDNGKAGPNESIQELQRLWKFPGGDSRAKL